MPEKPELLDELELLLEELELLELEELLLELDELEELELEELEAGGGEAPPQPTMNKAHTAVGNRGKVVLLNLFISSYTKLSVIFMKRVAHRP